MNEHVGDLISAYIDHELSENDKVHVERHVQICNECKALLDDLISVQLLISSNYQSLEVSDSMEDLVMQRIVEDSRIKEETFFWIRPVFSIASIAAVIAVLIPFLYFGGIITTFLHVTVSLISLVPIFISSIPMLMIGVMLFAAILAGLSIWSLRNLLGGGWIEKHSA